MTKQAPATGFSASERDYIRRELDMFFSARTNEMPLLVRISVHRNEYRTKY